MGVHHIFDGIRDDLARGQAVKHPVMAHGDAVIHRDRVELLGDASRRLDLARDELAKVLEVHVTRHELGEGIDHGDDRLAEIGVLHARGAPQAARARHVAAMCRSARSILRHKRFQELERLAKFRGAGSTKNGRALSQRWLGMSEKVDRLFDQNMLQLFKSKQVLMDQIVQIDPLGFRPASIDEILNAQNTPVIAMPVFI